MSACPALSPFFHLEAMCFTEGIQDGNKQAPVILMTQSLTALGLLTDKPMTVLYGSRYLNSGPHACLVSALTQCDILPPD